MTGLRAGIIGYGSAGRGIHGRLLREIGATVTRVVTRNPARATAAQKDWPGVAVDTTAEELLAHADQLDVVVIASPTGDHVAHVTAALAAGVRVVVDKPLATTAADAARLAELGGDRLTVFQNRRWDPEQLTVLALIADGKLGDVHRFERRWERWRPVPQDRWKENDPEAGGLLLDLGAHLVDSAIQLFGPVATVSAELRNLTTPAVDDVFLALRHTGGTISHLQAGSLVGAPGPRTRVLGSKGAYLVTSFEGEASPFSVLDDDGSPFEGRLVRGEEVTPVRRAAGGHPDFYRAVTAWALDGAPVPVDPADAVLTARVLDAAKVSAAEERAVRLD
ncbi:Gfo/Idh/MocA family protein [Cellulomonas taurus]|uniref:Gfo/Idh/MocA family protein n=1 Tax=Cellulomonas taurus TaxID=2729175 RepID=UPI00145E7281|nr:Gfo/Idh/MocA family oxidoreductase [Cellulomonas taurus]